MHRESKSTLGFRHQQNGYMFIAKGDSVAVNGRDDNIVGDLVSFTEKL